MTKDTLQNKVLLKGLDSNLILFKELKENQITNLILDINKNCNYQCLYCGNSHCQDVLSNTLTMTERKKIIFDAKELGATTVFFAGEGEPTIDPGFQELVRYNYNLGLTTIIYTNASMLTKKLTKFLYDNKVSLVVKIDSLKKECYNKIVNGDFFVTFLKGLSNIQEIYGNQNKFHEKGYSRVQVSTVITKYNVSEIEQLRNYSKQYGYIYCCKVPGKKGSSKDKWDDLVGENEGQLKELAKKYTDMEQTTSNIEGKCSISTYGMSVTRTGDGAICESVRDPSIGNIRNCSLEEMVLKRKKIFRQYNCPACIAKHLFNTEKSTTYYGDRNE